MKASLPPHIGPVVKWYYAAFALPSREFDSRQVHKYKKSRFAGFFVFYELLRGIERERPARLKQSFRAGVGEAGDF